MGTGRRLRASAGIAGALGVVAVGAYSVAAVAERAMKYEAAEDALYRCEPVSTDPAPLVALFPGLGTVASVTSATWCAKPPGDPEYGRITDPDPDDLVYYAVVRTSDLAGVEAALPGPWLPTAAGVGPADVPPALGVALPPSGMWVRDGNFEAYLDRASGTVVLVGARPMAPTPATPPVPTADGAGHP